MAHTLMFQQLEDRTEVIPLDTIGTTCGNPTTSVIYGFKYSPLDLVPRFALGYLDAGEQMYRVASVLGSMAESKYIKLHGELKKNPLDWADMADREFNLRSISARVRDIESSERVFSEIVSIVFNRT